MIHSFEELQAARKLMFEWCDAGCGTWLEWSPIYDRFNAAIDRAIFREAFRVHSATTMAQQTLRGRGKVAP